MLSKCDCGVKVGTDLELTVYTAGNIPLNTPKQSISEPSQGEVGIRTTQVKMAKGKGSGAKKETKASGNAKGKGKGKMGGKDEKDTESETKKDFNEVYVRHILWYVLQLDILISTVWLDCIDAPLQ